MYSVSVTVFRMSVVLSALIFVGTVAIGFLEAPSTDGYVEAARALNSRGSVVSYGVYAAFCLAWGVATLVGLVGLYFFWRPSRWIHAAGLVSGILMSPLLGIVVYSPYEMTLGGISSLLMIFAASVSFWSPLANRFDRQEAK